MYYWIIPLNWLMIAVPELFQMRLDAQRIASILSLSLEDVQNVVDQLQEEQ